MRARSSTRMLKTGGMGGLAWLACAAMPGSALGADVALLGYGAGIEAAMPWDQQKIMVPWSMTPDGSALVGSYALRSGPGFSPVITEAAVWTWADGVQILNNLGTPHDNRGQATAITDDGSRIFGRTRISDFNFAGATWTRDGALSVLPLPEEPEFEGSSTYITGCSADGSVVAGFCFINFSSFADGVLWYPDLNATQVLLPHYADGISADGLTVVGSENAAARVWYWRMNQDPVAWFIPTFPDAESQRALHLSRDGHVVLGTYSLPPENPEDSSISRTFRWSIEEGLTDLSAGGPCAFPVSAVGLNQDGSVVGGVVRCPGGQNGGMVWTRPHGWRWLRELLAQDYGVQFPAATSVEPVVISPNSRVWIIRTLLTDPALPLTQQELAMYAVRLPDNCAPQILSAPSAVDAPRGGTAVFTVDATHIGSSALGYEWRRNGVLLSDGPDLSGANTPTLTVRNVTGEKAGAYDCIVTNLCGREISASAELTTVSSCSADFDAQNGVQVADIFAFLRAWFANSPSADFDQQNGIQVADIFAFLRAWFAGC